MRKPLLSVLLLAAIAGTGRAQTLFSYGSSPVTKQEFLRVYQKNSLNKKPDFSEPALREYLDLYSLFRMKVREAEKQKLDTLESIQRELDNYRRQLAKNYLTDEQVTNKMVREAYDRSKEEVRVAHILIMAPANLSPEDTLARYRKIDSIYNLVTKGKGDFAALAKEFSEDRGSKDNGGDIGYMTALQTIYSFENVVYGTPKGKVSPPFRTQFGYHIVKVLDRRPSAGEVKVAQIMVAAPQSKGQEGIAVAQKKMDSIRAELKKGVPFEELAKKYSDDKYTAAEGGVMPQFGTGRMTPAFEQAAFALKKPGDVSQPVQTEYGLHLIKLLGKYPLKPFDSVSSQLKRKVDNDSRAQMARDIYFQKVKEKNGFKEYPANLDEITKVMAKVPDTGADANTFKLTDFKSMEKPIFSLGGRNYTQQDFVAYAYNLTRGRMMGPKAAVVKDIYNMYTGMVINDYQEHKLVEENPDFKNLMEEYRDGIMLFELMDRNVWGKASRDSAGLSTFFGQNKGKYLWDPGFKGAVYRFKDQASLDKGLKLIGKNNGSVKDEEMVKELNSEAIPDAVNINRSRYEFSRFTDVPQASIAKGKASAPVKNSDGSFTVVVADEIYNTPSPKTLDEARGYVVAEYQDYLEKNWNAKLRKEYPVKVDETVFKSMIK